MNKHSNQYYITDSGKILFTKNCMYCGRDTDFRITKDQYNRWVIQDEYIQDVFPEMTNEDREVMISGIHPDCWKELFENEEEEND